MRHSAVQDAFICLSIQYSYYLKQMKYLSCIFTRITLRCLSFGIEYCWVCFSPLKILNVSGLLTSEEHKENNSQQQSESKLWKWQAIDATANQWPSVNNNNKEQHIYLCGWLNHLCRFTPLHTCQKTFSASGKWLICSLSMLTVSDSHFFFFCCFRCSPISIVSWKSYWGSNWIFSFLHLFYIFQISFVVLSPF